MLLSTSECTTVTPATGEAEAGDHRFKASLANRARPYLKQKKVMSETEELNFTLDFIFVSSTVVA